MQVIGIVAEYNPFHTGHAYQIARTRQVLERDCAVVAVMSGNWVQGGRPAVLDKWTRARLALLGGVDLVLELPTVWAVSSAETFARGAVTILERSGVVDVLSFGSEYGDVEKLRRLAASLNTPEYEESLCRFVGEGMPFAAARQAAARLPSCFGGYVLIPHSVQWYSRGRVRTKSRRYIRRCGEGGVQREIYHAHLCKSSGT